MPNEKVFTSHSQRYPRAMARASTFIQQVHEMTKKGPRTMVATVVDASFHVTQGYALCTTELGLVRVYGIPYGSVCPQMRILARQQGAQNSNRSFVFDGYAPATSSASQSGSILYSALPSTSGAQVLSTSTSSLAAATSLTTSTGYYWHCFFYLPALPTIASTIFSMWTGTIATNVILDLLPSGLLRFRSGADGKGYITTTAVAPHQPHWIQIQPGLTGQELLVDGAANYTGLAAGAEPTFGGGTNVYTLLALTDPSGNYGVPLGSWISKWGFGMSFTSGVPLQLSTLTTIPGNNGDVDIPNMNTNATMKTSALYLCNDAAGATSAANTATGSSASALTLTAGLCSVSTLGPY